MPLEVDFRPIDQGKTFRIDQNQHALLVEGRVVRAPLMRDFHDVTPTRAAGPFDPETKANRCLILVQKGANPLDCRSGKANFHLMTSSFLPR